MIIVVLSVMNEYWELIFYSTFQITHRMSEVTNDKNSEILLYCRSGRRAEFAMSALQELGYRNVTNLRTLEAAEKYSKERLETAEQSKQAMSGWQYQVLASQLEIHGLKAEAGIAAAIKNP